MTHGSRVARPAAAPRPGRPGAHEPRVDFVVAGAQKSGTQALRHHLLAHPEIGLSDRHEVHYFDRRILTDRSDDHAGYHSQFTSAALTRCTGDVTPSYLWIDGCVGRMHSYNPDLRVIVLLRHPAERAYSQWAMEVERARMDRPFVVEVVSELVRDPRSRRQDRVRSLVARGFYSRQLEHLFAVFPRERCLVIRNEELSDHHAATMRAVYRFLGVGEVDPPPPARIHTRQYRPMPTVARWLLGVVYAREIRRLERLLAWDLRSWRRITSPGRPTPGDGDVRARSWCRRRDRAARSCGRGT